MAVRDLNLENKSRLEMSEKITKYTLAIVNRFKRNGGINLNYDPKSSILEEAKRICNYNFASRYLISTSYHAELFMESRIDTGTIASDIEEEFIFYFSTIATMKKQAVDELLKYITLDVSSIGIKYEIITLNVPDEMNYLVHEDIEFNPIAKSANRYNPAEVLQYFINNFVTLDDLLNRIDSIKSLQKRQILKAFVTTTGNAVTQANITKAIETILSKDYTILNIDPRLVFIAMLLLEVVASTPDLRASDALYVKKKELADAIIKIRTSLNDEAGNGNIVYRYIKVGDMYQVFVVPINYAKAAPKLPNIDELLAYCAVKAVHVNDIKVPFLLENIVKYNEEMEAIKARSIESRLSSSVLEAQAFYKSYVINNFGQLYNVHDNDKLDLMLTRLKDLYFRIYKRIDYFNVEYMVSRIMNEVYLADTNIALIEETFSKYNNDPEYKNATEYDATAIATLTKADLISKFLINKFIMQIDS